MAKYHYRDNLKSETYRNNNIRGNNKNYRKEDELTEESFVVDRSENLTERYKRKTISRRNKSQTVRILQHSSVHLVPSDSSIDSISSTLTKKIEKLTRRKGKNASSTIRKDKVSDNNRNRNIKTISDDFFYVVPMRDIDYPEAPKNILKRLKDVERISKQQNIKLSQNKTKIRKTQFTYRDAVNISRREPNNRDLNKQTKYFKKKLRPTITKNDSSTKFLNTHADLEKSTLEKGEKWVADSFHNLRENVLKFVSNKYMHTDAIFNEHNQNEEEIKVTEPTKLINSNKIKYTIDQNRKERLVANETSSECLGQDTCRGDLKSLMARPEHLKKYHQNISQSQNNLSDCYLKYAQSNLANSKSPKEKFNSLKNSMIPVKDKTGKNNVICDSDDYLGSDVLILNASDSQFFKITDFFKMKKPQVKSKKESEGKLFYESEIPRKETSFLNDIQVERSKPIENRAINEKCNLMRVSPNSLKDECKGKTDESTMKRLSKSMDKSSRGNLTNKMLSGVGASQDSDKSNRQRRRKYRNRQSSHRMKIEHHPSSLDIMPESDTTNLNKNLRSKKIFTQESDLNEAAISAGCNSKISSSKQSNKSSREPLKLIKLQCLELDSLPARPLKEPSKISDQLFLKAEQDKVSNKIASENSTLNEVEIYGTTYSEFQITENEPDLSIQTKITNLDKQPLSENIHQEGVKSKNNKSHNLIPSNQIIKKSKVSVSVAVQTDLQLLNDSDGESDYLKNTKGTITSDLDQYIYINKHLRSQMEKASPKFVQTEPLSILEPFLNVNQKSNISISSQSDVILEPVPIISEPDDFFEDFISYKNKKAPVKNYIDEPVNVIETSNKDKTNKAESLLRKTSEKQVSNKTSNEIVHKSGVEDLNETNGFNNKFHTPNFENVERDFQYYKGEFKYPECTGLQTLLQENFIFEETMLTLEEPPELLTKFMNEMQEKEYCQNVNPIAQREAINNGNGNNLDRDSELGAILDKNEERLDVPITLNLANTTSEGFDEGIAQSVDTLLLEEIHKPHPNQSMDRLNNPSLFFFTAENKPEFSAKLGKSEENSISVKASRTVHSNSRTDVINKEIKPEHPNQIEKYESFGSAIPVEIHSEKDTKLSSFEIPETKLSPSTFFEEQPYAIDPTVSQSFYESELIVPNYLCDEDKVRIFETGSTELTDAKCGQENNNADNLKLTRNQSVDETVEELPREYDKKSASTANMRLENPDIKLVESNVSSFDHIRLNISIRAKEIKDKHEPKSLPNIAYKKSLILLPINHRKHTAYVNYSTDAKYSKEITKNTDTNVKSLDDDLVDEIKPSSSNIFEIAFEENAENVSTESELKDKELMIENNIELCQTNSLEIATLFECESNKITSKYNISIKSTDNQSQTVGIEKSKRKTKTSIRKKLNRLFLCHYLTYIPFIVKIRKLGRQNSSTVHKGVYSTILNFYAKNQMLDDSLASIENSVNELLRTYCF